MGETGGERLLGRLRVKASLFQAQLSLYLGGASGREATADNALRAYLDRGVRLRCEGGFFTITTRAGVFRCEEIVLGVQTTAQNILTGEITTLPQSIYFMPAGWKMYTYCPCKEKPIAEAGDLLLEFAEDERTLEADYHGEMVMARLGCVARMIAGSAGRISIHAGGEGRETSEVLLIPQWAMEGEASGGPAAFFMPLGEKKRLMLLLADRPDIEALQEEAAGQPLPVDATKPLLAHPSEFAGLLTVYYYLGREGRAKIEIYDYFGRLAATIIDEDTMPGAHEMRFDGTLANGKRIASGPHMLRYKIDGKEVASQEVVALKKPAKASFF